MMRANNILSLLTMIIALTAAAVNADNAVDTSTVRNNMAGTYFGFGAGLSIGSIPVFTMWQNTLPETMGRLGITQNFGADPLVNDTMPLRYRVSEIPDQFNFTLPLSVSLHSIKPGSAMSFALSFFHNSKQFQSILLFDRDTLNRRISIYETMRYYSLSIEAAYQKAIPPVFFSIDGAQQAYLSMSIGLSPINTFTRDNGVKLSAPENDLRMQTLADSVQKSFTGLSSNGMSLIWRFGISTIKSYGQGGGIEMGLYYGGSYASYFYNEGERVNNGQIDPASLNAGKPLSFISNRIEFKAAFLRSSSSEKLVSQ
ncbi:MAG: hypothetical protein FWC23_02170 [Chitinispirillia bacterium]|nr:hypothetical protein [Chitinispirillia bacterium]MCL2267985.1 hypothetical protein [Chitinispirillia bacterium]